MGVFALVVCVFIASQVLGTSSTRISINENGYSNILFAISPKVPSTDAEKIIDNIKFMMSEASTVLYTATRSRAYFKDATILIPPTWTRIEAGSTTWQSWDEADVKIDSSGGNESRPYTLQPKGCGERGLYINFTDDFIRTMNESDKIKEFGTPGKVFVHEWAHLRYGVFDEYKKPGDKYSLFTRKEGTGISYPNLCAGEIVTSFTTKDIVTGESCVEDENGDFDDNCIFELGPQFKPKSSLLSIPYIDSVSQFCDEGQLLTHNTDNRNEHNDKCGGRSVWQVVEGNEDFKNERNPRFDLNRTSSPKSLSTKITVVRPPTGGSGDGDSTTESAIWTTVQETSTTVQETSTTVQETSATAQETSTTVQETSATVQETSATESGGRSTTTDAKSTTEVSSPTTMAGKPTTDAGNSTTDDIGSQRYVLTIDVSSNMAKCGRLQYLNEMVRHWIMNDFPTSASLAIVQFSANAKMLSDFVVIKDKGTRMKMTKRIPSKTIPAKRGTCIACGLRMALDMLELGGGGGNIVLFTGGRNEPALADTTHVLHRVEVAKTRVITVGLGLNADPYLEVLADRSNGKSYFVPHTNSSDGVEDALSGAITFQPYVRNEDIRIKLYSKELEVVRTMSKIFTQGQFHVDPSVGRNTEIKILNLDRVSITSVKLTDPKNHSFIANFTSKTSTSILLPSATMGTWKFAIYLIGKPTQKPKVIVTTRQNVNTLAPIKTKCWFAESAVRNAAEKNLQIFAHVTKNNCPVVNATVRIYIEKPNGEVETTEMSDSGVNADSMANDGIYSKYYTNATLPGRYSVLCQVLNKGAAYVNQGFIASFIPGRDYVPDPKLFSQTPVEQFSRIENAGSFRVEVPVSEEDAYPPGRVTDLDATIVDVGRKMLKIQWTAPGDDLDSGTVSRYEIKYSTVYKKLTNNFEEDSPLLVSITEEHVVDGSLEPLKVGSMQTAIIALPVETGVRYFLALRAVDKALKKSSVSNVAPFYLTNPREQEDSEELQLDDEKLQSSEEMSILEDPIGVDPNESSSDREMFIIEMPDYEELPKNENDSPVGKSFFEASMQDSSELKYFPSSAVFILGALGAAIALAITATLIRKLNRPKYHECRNDQV